MKKLLSLLGTMTIIGSSIPTVVAVSSYNERINLRVNKNNIREVALVSADEAKNRENRWFRHSEFKPTGYFLEAGIKYEIIINKNEYLTNIFFRVGQWGKYKNINNGHEYFESFLVIGETSIVIPEYSGVLYIEDNNQTDLEVIDIVTDDSEEFIKIPTFKINETDQTEFITQIKTTKSPFVEFVSKHYFATMQTDMIKNVVLSRPQHSFNVTLNHWDNVWNWTNDFYGLNAKNKDISKKFPQYIHIANEDNSWGYANATHGRVMFQNSTGAGKDLFLDQITDQWPLWHETGHTYQTLQYKWHDLTEVSNNLSALYIQQKLGIQLRIYKESEKQQAIKRYLAQQNENKDFNNLSGDIGSWIRLGMLWQLQMGFGHNFYPVLNKIYRQINNGKDSESMPRFDTDEKKIQMFIRITSYVTDYNLKQFFNEWGIKLTAETENIISRYKPLTKPIWNNIAELKTEFDPIIQEMVPFKLVEIE
ncbi:hypothetical protein S100390_v1c01750 [Spiroplasma sp. NBRC 100390]|uniref:M60 family metallopeptidase n=1 Tax=unclassified Spiroplasma TaxID=2637901 RepID=UPI000892A398|nr:MULTISPECIES: M60 family metallopeptidase [unclassified Spiroplasma]AOX43518.1 hypothetical protein STU14_v1c01750 [Spiroplasma sp. TU-14]APE12988.1 hypothetical protein S100390_v1c01750 [Spiroplasma sp. NBRC 100390]